MGKEAGPGGLGLGFTFFSFLGFLRGLVVLWTLRAIFAGVWLEIEGCGWCG